MASLFETNKASLTQRLLARGEGGGDLLARGVVGGGGELGLQLGLHRPLALEDELRAGVAPGSELGGLQGDRSLGKVANWTRQERPC